MKSEFFYGRLDPEHLTIEVLKTMVWRYFMTYWNRCRICSANGGLSPLLKPQRFFAALVAAAYCFHVFALNMSTDIDKITIHCSKIGLSIISFRHFRKKLLL